VPRRDLTHCDDDSATLAVLLVAMRDHFFMNEMWLVRIVFA
jgi:hypothetical protein